MIRRYIVKGRVQGVGFRWFVHREAAALNLNGWVRNTDSGDVEIMASGDPGDLARLRKGLERGSRGSRVDAVLESKVDEEIAGELKSFHIEGAW